MDLALHTDVTQFPHIAFAVRLGFGRFGELLDRVQQRLLQLRVKVGRWLGFPPTRQVFSPKPRRQERRVFWWVARKMDQALPQLRFRQCRIEFVELLQIVLELNAVDEGLVRKEKQRCDLRVEIVFGSENSAER
jgi:hypothetical protein